MTGPEIETYINSLSSSGSRQGYSANFGVGAKIAAGKENPRGLVYKSWVGGKGVIARFWKDPDVGYGLWQYESEGHYSHYLALPDDDLKTAPIDDCGTSVTLLGESDSENTYARPGLKQKWLIEYLNSRYFEIPGGVSIRVRDFSNAAPSDWPTSPDVGMGSRGSQMRAIRGMRSLLEANCEAHGVVELKDARAHWYLLPENLNVGGGGLERQIPRCGVVPE